MLYILFGQDDFSLSQVLDDIKRGIGDQSLLSANTTTLDGQQMSLDQLRNACETVPFLAGKRLVIVDGLLGRFEARTKPSRQKNNARKPAEQSEHKVFSNYVVGIPDSTILVLVDGDIDKKRNNPLLKELSAKAEVKRFRTLKVDELKQWIQRRVKEESGSISPLAVDLLAHVVGGNLWVMSSEIDKLIQFASGRTIDEEDVRKAVSYMPETNVYAMIDAILEFKAGLAERLLEQLLQGGANPVHLLFLLSRQIQMIVRAKELVRQQKPNAEIQSKLGLTAEFALYKTLERADRYPMERLKEVYQKLLQTDLSIKTGKYNGELALNILIAELCQKTRVGKTK